MIVSTEYKFVFISMPKTGSHSMYDLLTREFKGQQLGPGFHRTKLPEDIETDYTIFSTVRNPYDRLVACWNTLLETSARDRYGSRGDEVYDNFLDFCKFVSYNKNRLDHVSDLRVKDLVISQHRWYEKLPRYVIPLHIENIDEQFHLLPFVNKRVTIPHKVKRNHSTWDDLKTKEIIELANDWAGPEFGMFGYTKEY